MLFFFSSRRRHTRWPRDWSSDVCSSDLSTPDTLFAIVAKADGTGLLGLWKTTNASSGSTADWIQQTSTPDFCTSSGGSQCFYDLIIRISPQNPNLLFAGGSSGDSQAIPFNSR